MVKKPKLAVFASGTGSNLAALLKAAQADTLGGDIVRVVIDRKSAGAIAIAEAANIPVLQIRYPAFATREAAEQEIVKTLVADGVTGILLAGYMRILTPYIVQAFEQRILNIHPALLPSFPGNNTIEDAWNAGVKVTGVTIHYVDTGVDSGQIIAQTPVLIPEDETIDELTERIHDAEHHLYPETVAKLIKEGVFQA